MFDNKTGELYSIEDYALLLLIYLTRNKDKKKENAYIVKFISTNVSQCGVCNRPFELKDMFS